MVLRGVRTLHQGDALNTRRFEQYMGAVRDPAYAVVRRRRRLTVTLLRPRGRHRIDARNASCGNVRREQGRANEHDRRTGVGQRVRAARRRKEATTEFVSTPRRLPCRSRDQCRRARCRDAETAARRRESARRRPCARRSRGRAARPCTKSRHRYRWSRAAAPSCRRSQHDERERRQRDRAIVDVGERACRGATAAQCPRTRPPSSTPSS